MKRHSSWRSKLMRIATRMAGTENFYAITRYNWSSYYAMAVIELGRAVAQKAGAHAR